MRTFPACVGCQLDHSRTVGPALVDRPFHHRGPETARAQIGPHMHCFHLQPGGGSGRQAGDQSQLKRSNYVPRIDDDGKEMGWVCIYCREGTKIRLQRPLSWSRGAGSVQLVGLQKRHDRADVVTRGPADAEGSIEQCGGPDFHARSLPHHPPTGSAGNVLFH